jgi:polysaccharide export outer membrane protein
MRSPSKWIALTLLLAPGLKAQTKESLLIGPGDLLHIQVFDTPELEERARVTDAGELPLVMGGSVKVSALTPAQAAKAIQDSLLREHLLLNPRVLVGVEQYATQNVTILGEVRAPGAFPIGTPRTIVEVLALAGGLTDLADRKVLIERHGSTDKVPYFVSNLPDAALDSAVQVNPGDTIIVPKAGIVYALGDVGRPGGYTMTNNEGLISVLELVARAGGTPPNAVPSHARLIRKIGGSYTETPLPLSAMQKGKRPDLPLQADDIVYVPFSYLLNFGMQASGIAASIGSAAVYKF